MSALPRRLGRVVVLSERRATPAPVTTGGTLDDILGDRALTVHYQPILERDARRDGARWQLAGAEALVRAQACTGTALRPAQFLPQVERSGLMPTLFQFVLADALTTLLEWERDAGVRLDVAVNLHSAALLDAELPRFLFNLLDAVGVDPTRLTLELTETSPISDLRRAARTLAALRATGVRVALDDFGAGFSTTTRLDWLACDELKIDRALVQGLEHSEEQRCVVHHLVALAHGHGMQACAEGVETQAALRLLDGFGCDRVQGYLVARPQPAARLLASTAGWPARGSGNRGGAGATRQLPLPGFASREYGGHGEHDATA